VFEWVSIFDFTLLQWILAVLCGIIIGFSKTGIGGMGILVVPIFAAMFGGKPSVGLVLPMLCIADIFAVKYYNRHAKWNYVIKLLPWAFVGILVGTLVGNELPDIWFKRSIALVVLASLGVMIWRDFGMKEQSIPDQWWFAALLGLVAGFATMIGNAAGPIMAVYLLAMHLPRHAYIGTGAWYFMIVNLSKVPFHVAVWGTITWDTLAFNGLLIPAIVVGALAGIWVIKRIPEKPFRFTIIGFTALASFYLFF
jgi:uncharacterized protein